MNKVLRLFQSEEDNAKQAILLILELSRTLNYELANDQLLSILDKYKSELIRKELSIPCILSRMNISISNSIRVRKPNLSVEQSKQLKTLQSLSKIR